MSESKLIEENTKLIKRAHIAIIYVCSICSGGSIIQGEEIIVAIVMMALGITSILFTGLYCEFTIFGPMRQFEEDMKNEDYTPRSVWNGD